jgi:pyruvate/2-oxoglutarate dehydrogenase complex dihydrolipoamide acyltransferase (E2) component
MAAQRILKLVRWYKDDGAVVQSGDPICEIETDKASVDIQAPVNGVLRQRAKPGSLIRTVDDICLIEPISD